MSDMYRSVLMERIAELEEQNSRLMSRGIEDMQHRITELEDNLRIANTFKAKALQHKQRADAAEDKLDCSVKNMKSMEVKMISDQATLAMVKREAAANCDEMDYTFMGCQLNRIEKILSGTRKPMAVVENPPLMHDKYGQAYFSILVKDKTKPGTVIVLPKEAAE